MSTEQFTVANVKCQGCVKNIETNLAAMAGIDAVSVDVATGVVEVTGAELNRAELAAKLSELGYPEQA